MENLSDNSEDQQDLPLPRGDEIIGDSQQLGLWQESHEDEKKGPMEHCDDNRRLVCGDVDILEKNLQGSSVVAKTTTEVKKNRVDRELVLGPGDVVIKFDHFYQIVLGKVFVHSESLDLRVEWDDNTIEPISKTKEGKLAFCREICVVNRKGVGVGTEVTDGKRRGWVRSKRCLATVSLNESPDIVIEDVPVEILARPNTMKKDVKMLYRNDWIGLVVNTKSKVHFKVDKEEKIGWLDGEGFNSSDPIPGEKIPKLSISMLWDTRWSCASDYWLWNLLKYLGNPATVLRTEAYRLHVAWMGRVGKQIMDMGDNTPPNEIEGLETVSEVQLLYGRNETYVKQHDVWMYTVREGDSPLVYDLWTRNLHDALFVNPTSSDWDSYWNNDESQVDTVEVEEPYEITPGNNLPVTIVVFRSVFEVDWEDGTSEMSETVDVWPTNNFVSKLKPGDIVRDYGMSWQSCKYGYVEKIERRGMVKVKWVDASTKYAPLVSTNTVSKFDIALVEEWKCLKSLNDCPLVVCEVQLVPSSMRVGVLVGVSVPDAKIIVRFMDDTERLVWAHDYPRFKGDIQFNYGLHIWAASSFPENNELSQTKTVLPIPSVQVYENCTAAAKYHFRIHDIDPTFNSFSECEFIPRHQDARFQIHLQKEVNHLNENLPDGKDMGVWVETYSIRPDLFTATVVGPYGTIYEGHLILLDFMLPFDYPDSPIKVSLNTRDKSLVDRLFSCGYEDGVLRIPSSVASHWEQKSTILNIITYIRDVIMIDPKIPPEELSPDNKQQDQVNSMYLSVLEYTYSILRYPHPDTLDTERHEFIITYFGAMLHKIIQSNEEYLAGCEDKTCFMDDAGDGMCGFTVSLKSRLEKLRDLLPNPESTQMQLEQPEVHV